MLIMSCFGLVNKHVWGVWPRDEVKAGVCWDPILGAQPFGKQNNPILSGRWNGMITGTYIEGQIDLELQT